jgi:glyoxylase-like metal-dependent hydrolase (beta-lactamase superfamily II)
MSSFRIISIGALAAHSLWNERAAVRTGHCTTTLVVAGDMRMIVDPGLPPAVIAARLNERSGLRADDITHVFLTGFDDDHVRGLPAFDRAAWWLHEPELDAAVERLAALREASARLADPAAAESLTMLLQRLDRMKPAPDQLARGVDLFPLPGVSPGTCGLLLPQAGQTVLVCGDAVPTIEHVQQRKVLPGCWDVDQAMESFREALEIADMLIPGRDNQMMNWRHARP